MIQISTPINGACPEGEQCHTMSDVVPEEDQRFSDLVSAQLRRISLQPDASVVKRVLDYSVRFDEK